MQAVAVVSETSSRRVALLSGWLKMCFMFFRRNSGATSHFVTQALNILSDEKSFFP